MGRIAVLPDELINQIAAGEVVERPASVVKELCENAIDAGARTIRVKLAGGGLAAIVVQDDGCGMSRDDALLAIGRHATSKLRTLEDLNELSTMGFRGEALPSIASVARMTLTTAEAGAAQGTRVELSGGEPPVVSDAPPVTGTRVEVAELFFNTPARRKFLRREQTEVGHCQDAVARLALAHPEVAFFAEHEGRMLVSAPWGAADLSERVCAVLGPKLAPHLLRVEERRLGLSVTGFVTSPEHSEPNARSVFTFVNRRYVRDRGLNHAIQRAFQDALPHGRQPVAVLSIEIDPHAVDVNVHPQKQEVRFADGRAVYDAVLAGVARALQQSPWLAARTTAALSNGPEAVPGAHYAHAVERFLARARTDDGGGFSPLSTASEGGAPALLFDARGVEGRPAFGQARPGLNESPPPGYFSALRFLALLGQRFWLCEAPGGTLVVVDPHAARERVLLHSLVRGAGRNASQAGLFSATVELPAPVRQRLLTSREALARVGLLLEEFGGGSVVVRGIPPGLERADPSALLESLAELLPVEGLGDHLPSLKVLERLACLGSELTERSASHDEARLLLSALDEADFHHPAAHRSVVVFELSLLELERRTGRQGS